MSYSTLANSWSNESQVVMGRVSNFSEGFSPSGGYQYRENFIERLTPAPDGPGFPPGIPMPLPNLPNLPGGFLGGGGGIRPPGGGGGGVGGGCGGMGQPKCPPCPNAPLCPPPTNCPPPPPDPDCCASCVPQKCPPVPLPKTCPPGTEPK